MRDEYLPIALPIGSSRIPVSPLVGVPFFARSWQEALPVRSVSGDGSIGSPSLSTEHYRQHSSFSSSPVVSHGRAREGRPAARPRLHQSEAQEIYAALSERDREILASFGERPLFTGEQLERLHCTDLSPASRGRRRRDILNRMVRLDLLDKLPRRVGGLRSGSAGAVFGLGVIGERLVPQGRRSRWRGGVALVAHTLGVSEVFVRLKEAETSGLVRGTEFVSEPQCWQTIDAGNALDEDWTLKPDALLSYERDGVVERWFVELDRGTESPSTLRKKMSAYEEAWEAGLNIRGVMPRVWWVEMT